MSKTSEHESQTPCIRPELNNHRQPNALSPQEDQQLPKSPKMVQQSPNTQANERQIKYLGLIIEKQEE